MGAEYSCLFSLNVTVVGCYPRASLINCCFIMVAHDTALPRDSPPPKEERFKHARYQHN
jgi:hypothetical protein